MSGPESANGLVQSLRRMADTLLGLARLRLELLGTELEQQKHKLFDALLWAAFGLMLAGVAVVLFVAFVVMLFQDGYRLPALAVLTLAFAAGAWALMRQARTLLRTEDGGPFALSLGELEGDQKAVAAAADKDPS